MPSANPTKNWARIEPEFPRAPFNEASATASATLETRLLLLDFVSSEMVARTKVMLVPVSPSGTGNTLILLR